MTTTYGKQQMRAPQQRVAEPPRPFASAQPAPEPLPAFGERILAEGVFVSNDGRTTGLNGNDAIIGASGSGKTRSYVKPNLLCGQGSFIVADTKGELCRSLRTALEGRGYEVQLVDLTNMAASPWGYNPLRFVRRDAGGRPAPQDVMALAGALSPQERQDDPFWDESARLQLSALIGYVLEALPEDERHLGSVAEMFSRADARGKLLGRLFDERETVDPRSFAAQKWRMARSVMESEKTQGCIQGFMAQKLDSFVYEAPIAMFTKAEQVDFAELGRRKIALFVNVSDTDRSHDRLVNMLYTQALHELIRAADAEREHRLRVPVRIVLDDFAANSVIPDFDRIVSVVRSRGISVSIIIQSLSQLSAMYDEARASTILNNCDHCLYLGGQDVETARFIGAKADKPIGTVLALPVGSAYLFERGARPRLVRQFDLARHEPELMLRATRDMKQYQRLSAARSERERAAAEREEAARRETSRETAWGGAQAQPRVA